MNSPATICPIDLPPAPLEVLQAMPRDVPVMMLHSGDAPGQWSRWSVLAQPEGWFRCDPDGRSHLHGAAPRIDLVHDPLQDLEGLLSRTTCRTEDHPEVLLPFTGGWIGYLSYELGAWIEPCAVHTDRDHPLPSWPLMELAWCPSALIYDHHEKQWYTVGQPHVPACRGHDDPPLEASIGHWTAHPMPDDHVAAIDRVLEYIRAGDIFQANLTRTYHAHYRGVPRHLAAEALSDSRARYGSLLECPGGRCIISMSPELFLDASLDTGIVTTRPIKGTLHSGADPEDLLRSEKDQAELYMIIDLMRNDLGRVCRTGSVRVVNPRVIETHPTVHHGVGEVTGNLDPGTTAGDLLRATFPAGSITGAPKIRAMQIIDELESQPRGPYCGAIGCFSSNGRILLNVGIRTMLMQQDQLPSPQDGGRVSYGVGGGIVSDSDSQSEYDESRDKAAILSLSVKSAVPI